MKKWVLQVAIPSHDSKDGFMTHCKWNLCLKQCVGGVPIVAWPLYAKQKTNSTVLMVEMKVALALRESEQNWSVLPSWKRK